MVCGLASEQRREGLVVYRLSSYIAVQGRVSWSAPAASRTALSSRAADLFSSLPASDRCTVLSYTCINFFVDFQTIFNKCVLVNLLLCSLCSHVLYFTL